jgi:polyisoprenoid-binding protein YceI
MLRTTLATVGLLASLAAPVLAAPDTYTMDKQHTEAAFQVRHILTKVRGTFRDVDGVISWDKANPEKSSVQFRLKTVSVDTGVAMRDNDLRSANFFWAEKYPEILFVSTKIVPKGTNQFEVTGTLTIRGVTKVITLPVTYLGEAKDPYGNTKAGFETGITIVRQDYGLVWNKALETGGVLVGDQVEITVNIEAAKNVAPASTN